MLSWPPLEFPFELGTLHWPDPQAPANNLNFMISGTNITDYSLLSKINTLLRTPEMMHQEYDKTCNINKS